MHDSVDAPDLVHQICDMVLDVDLTVDRGATLDQVLQLLDARSSLVLERVAALSLHCCREESFRANSLRQVRLGGIFLLIETALETIEGLPVLLGEVFGEFDLRFEVLGGPERLEYLGQLADGGVVVC